VSQARQDLIGVCFIAGQFVMAGFLNLRVKKWIRVVVTRLVAIVPTVIVENELDNLSEWLNVLQSIQLPFALIPLLCLVSNTRIMGVFVISNITKVRRCRETLDSAIGLVYLL
jgi:NRAMP (natural resistance-associated macrophage protein)-like metal ion transporter